MKQELKSESKAGQAVAIADPVEQTQVVSPPPPSSSPPKSKSKLRLFGGLSLAQGLFWSFAFVLTTTVSATLGATLALVTPLSSTLAAPFLSEKPGDNDRWWNGLNYQVSRPVTILVMGIDRVLGASSNSAEIFEGRSDTMLLVHIDPEKKSINVLSIPRDTQVYIPGLGTSKVNAANAYGGPALTGDVLRDTMNGLTIDRYVRVSTEAFRELVNLLGGVEVFVPQPMSYVDYTQKLKIDLSQGWQTLNGDQAEQFARFRHDAYGDIGRVQRQQMLMKSLRNRLSSPAVIPKLPQIINMMQKYVDTNLSIEEMLAVATFGLQLDQGNFRQVLLPGRFSDPGEFAASYWVMDDAGRDRVLETYFNLQPKTANNGTSDATTASMDNLRIAIQNASDQPEAGEQFARYLRERGFSNVYVIEDWSDRLRQTQIIAQTGDVTAATNLQKMLGLGQIEADSTGELGSDLTLRIGADWKAPTSGTTPAQ